MKLSKGKLKVKEIWQIKKIEKILEQFIEKN